MIEGAPMPMPGDWYQLPTGEQFEVVALDENAGTLEIQYFDGSLEEIEEEVWDELAPEAIAPPEDWSGSLDVPPEDPALEVEVASSETWASFIDRMDR